MLNKKKILFFVLVILLACLKPFHVEAKAYFLTYSDEKKFVWFRVAKTGTRTTYNLLLNHINDLTHLSHGTKFHPNKFRNYFKFSFVRNPWARIVSCYVNKSQNHFRYKECWGKDFDFFVDFIERQDLRTADRHIRLQTELIPVNELDFIGRLENFAEDLKYVTSVIGIKDYVLEHRNKSSHKHYREYYTPRTRKIIARKYKKDIETFGYFFEVLKK